MPKNFIAPIIIISLIVLAAVAWLVSENPKVGTSPGLLTPTPTTMVDPTVIPTILETPTIEPPDVTVTPTLTPKVTTKPPVTITLEPTVSN